MLKKIAVVFMRDVKVSVKDFIGLYIILFPVIFAMIINVFTPGINDSTVNLAMIEGDNPEQVAYLEDYAKVQVFADEDAVIKRVKERDNYIGLVPSEGAYKVIAHGDEPEGLIDFAKMLNFFYEKGITAADTEAIINDFGRDTPPLKTVLVNVGVIFSAVLGGMLITINIVEEKADNTISAMNVTPISRWGYILGKGAIGVIMPIISSIIMLMITGYTDINFLQVMVLLITSGLVGLILGFYEGLNNDDVMNAVGNVKLIFLPLFGSIAAIELLADKWQWLFYWIPFYWTYKGNQLVLSGRGQWPEILLYAGIVVLISAVVFLLMAPKIRKGLE